MLKNWVNTIDQNSKWNRSYQKLNGGGDEEDDVSGEESVGEETTKKS